MAKDFSAQVTAGMSLLDQQRPGWRSEIDLGTLDLGNCQVCVLGQIFGDYEDGLEALDISDPYKYGFNAVEGMYALTQAWKDALGKNKVLVEVGDIYTDESGCCGIKVVQTEMVSVDGETITVYLVKSGYVSSGELKESSGVSLVRKDVFEENGGYPKRLVQFKPKRGMFITNDTGKVYYVRSETIVREIADQSRSYWLSDIDQKGLREVVTSSGILLSEIVNR